MNEDYATIKFLVNERVNDLQAKAKKHRLPKSKDNDQRTNGALTAPAWFRPNPNMK